MKPLTVLVFLIGLNAAAQDLAIQSARIIIGNGAVINQGAIVIREGRIVSVGPGAASIRSSFRKDDYHAV